MGFPHKISRLTLAGLLPHGQFIVLISKVGDLWGSRLIERLGHMKATTKQIVSLSGRRWPRALRFELFLIQKGAELRNDLESVCHIENIGFAARPTTVGIEIDGPAFIDETPSDHVWFFTMTAG